MLFMVIETFADAEGVYKRFEERGRMIPDGLKYIDSWVEPDRSRCFQLMETERRELLDHWTANWEDIVDFEIVPVVTSAEAKDL